MGFLAGFGQGFSDSFNQARAIREQKNARQFDLYFNEFSKRRDQYEKDKKADEQAIRTAKDLVTGMPGVPEQAWVNAYKWLRTGVDVATVEARLRNTKFTAKPDVTDETSKPMTLEEQTQSIQQQPLDVMNDNGAAPVVEQPQQTQPTEMTPLEKLQNVFNPDVRRQQQEIQMRNRVVDTAGVQNNQYDQIMQGYTPEDIPVTMQGETTDSALYLKMLNEFGLEGSISKGDLVGADLKANAYMQSGDPEQQKMAELYRKEKPVLEEALGSTTESVSAKDAATLLDKINPEETKLNQQVADLKSFTKEAMDMRNFVKSHKEAITAVGGVTEFFYGLKNEAETALNIAAEFANRNPDASERDVLSEVQKELAATDDSSIDKIGKAKAEFNARLIRLAIKAGKASGISGQNMSDKDFKKLMDTIQASNDFATFDRNLKTYVSDSLNSVENNRQAFTNNSIYRFLTTYGDNQLKEMYSQYESPIAEDEAFNDINTWLGSAEESATSDTPQTDKAMKDQPKQKGQIITVTEELAKADPALKSLVGRQIIVDANSNWEPYNAAAK